MTEQSLPLIPWSRTRLSTARNSAESAVDVQHTALDLYVLGYPESAKRLVDTLYEVHHGFQFSNSPGIYTCHALYSAWETGCGWAPWAFENASTPFILNGRNTGGKELKEKRSTPPPWTHGIYEDVKNKAERGKLGEEDAHWALEHVGRGPDADLTIGKAVQIAMLAGEQAVAEKIISEEVWKVYAHLQEQLKNPKVDIAKAREQVHQRLEVYSSPLFWKAMPSHPVTGSLSIDEDALQAFIDEGCGLIRTRFTQGPARPYANHSTTELLKIMDESYIAARKANPEAGEHMSILSTDSLPATFLATGATDTQIAECESRLSENAPNDQPEDSKVMLPDKKLPADYIEFLKISNGFQLEPGDQTGMLCSVEEVGDQDVMFLHDLDFTLFPYEYTSVSDIDNISLGDFTCFSIGYGGDEGQVVLVPPSSVKPVIAAFEKAYRDANEVERLMYDRAALDLYGGIEKVKDLEWLCIVWYHWDVVQHIWGGFSEYLEECVREAVQRRATDEAEARDNGEDGDEEGAEKDKVEEEKEEGEKEEAGVKRTLPVSDLDAVKDGVDGRDVDRYDLRDTKARRTG